MRLLVRIQGVAWAVEKELENKKVVREDNREKTQKEKKRKVKRF
jgi:hypothetical protein